MDTLQLPPIENAYYNHEQNYTLHPDLIFVFGSNLAGRHGAGAALAALNFYGAVYGRGVGLNNSSYAIPTKDRNLIILPIKSIKFYVDQFVSFTETSNRHFYVTPIGTGYARYKHSDIAPLFKNVKNCWLPEVWKPYIET